MIVLAFESSAKAASVALTDGSRIIAQSFLNCGLTHSETLLAMARDILKSTKYLAKDLDVVAAAHGPGSFTGVRIGIAAAEGFAWGASKPVCGVSTLKAMACSLTESGAYKEDAIICPVMDARRGEVYNAIFLDRNGYIERLTPDRSISLDNLIDECAHLESDPILIGDGSYLAEARFMESGARFRAAPEALRQQTAYGVALAALKSKPSNRITPNYLRVSGAERLHT